MIFSNPAVRCTVDFYTLDIIREINTVMQQIVKLPYLVLLMIIIITTTIIIG